MTCARHLLCENNTQQNINVCRKEGQVVGFSWISTDPTSPVQWLGVTRHLDENTQNDPHYCYWAFKFSRGSFVTGKVTLYMFLGNTASKSGGPSSFLETEDAFRGRGKKICLVTFHFKQASLLNVLAHRWFVRSVFAFFPADIQAKERLLAV